MGRFPVVKEKSQVMMRISPFHIMYKVQALTKNLRRQTTLQNAL